MLLTLLLMVTLLSLNVNSIHDSNKWKNIFNTILAVSPQNYCPTGDSFDQRVGVSLSMSFTKLLGFL